MKKTMAAGKISSQKKEPYRPRAGRLIRKMRRNLEGKYRKEMAERREGGAKKMPL